MRKIAYFGLVALLFLLFSCGEAETPEKFIEINDVRYELSSATSLDNDVNSDNTYRSYKLVFKSSELNPSTYIEFDLFSMSTTRIQEGVYKYRYSKWGPGDVSNIEVGINIKYDDMGQAVSGTRYNVFNSEFEGYVEVTKENDDYKFTFELEADDNGKRYVMHGIYSDALTEI